MSRRRVSQSVMASKKASGSSSHGKWALLSNTMTSASGRRWAILSACGHAVNASWRPAMTSDGVPTAASRSTELHVASSSKPRRMATALKIVSAIDAVSTSGGAVCRYAGANSAIAAASSLVGGGHRGQQRSKLVGDRRSLGRWLLSGAQLARCRRHEDQCTHGRWVAYGQLLGDEPAERVADHDHRFARTDRSGDGRGVVGPLRHGERCRVRAARAAVAAVIDVDEVQHRRQRVEAAVRLLVDTETAVQDEGDGTTADLLHEQLCTIDVQHRHNPPPLCRDPFAQVPVQHGRTPATDTIRIAAADACDGRAHPAADRPSGSASEYRVHQVAAPRHRTRLCCCT